MKSQNHCAHLIDALEFSKSKMSDRFALEAMHLMLRPLRSGQKFSLELQQDSNLHSLFASLVGDDLKDVLNKFCSPLRLPYESIAIEGSEGIEGAFEAYVLTAEQTGSEEITCHAAFLGSGGWAIHSYGFVLRKNGFVDYFVCSEKAKERGFGFEEIDTIMNPFLSTLIGFIAALNCSNVSAARESAPSRLSNERRKKKGKQPFFTYHTLLVDQHERQSSEYKGGNHASPRVHLRRGHIRRLPDKNVWVNATVVGNKSAGMVHKDYQLS